MKKNTIDLKDKNHMKKFIRINPVVISVLSIIVILSASLFFIIKSDKGILDGILNTVYLISILLFIFMFCGLYFGFVVDKINLYNYKFNFISTDSIPFIEHIEAGTGFIDVSDNIIINILASIIIWIFVTIILVILITIFINIIWLVLFLISFLFLWIFYNTYRMIFRFSKKCRKNIFKSVLYSMIFTVLFSGWMYLILFSLKFIAAK